MDTGSGHAYAGKTGKRAKLSALLLMDTLGMAAVICLYCLFYILPRAAGMVPATAPAATATMQATQAAVQASLSPTLAEASSAPAETTAPAETPSAEPAATPSPTSASGNTAVVDPGMWGDQFADKFTNGPAEITDTSYRSNDISVTIRQNQSNGVTWYVADVYMKNLQNFKTAFAKGRFGGNLIDKPLNIANEVNAVVAITGDYYGYQNKGIVIRNGVLYRKTPLEDVLVMNNDGSMQTFGRRSLDTKTLFAGGAWQAWSFGPMLLANGQPMTKFTSNVTPRNPRCAIGYFEPGHYCLVVVDGRQNGYSGGITLKDLSQLMYGMGCKAAYNLDGGRSAVMTFMGKCVNQPYKNGRDVSDIVYIGE